MEADKKQKSPTVPRLRVIYLECVVWSLIRGWNVDSEFVREVCENKNTGVSVPRKWFEKSRTSTRTTTLNFYSKTSHTSCQCHKKIEKKWQIFIFAVSIVGWLKAIVRDLGLQSNVFFLDYQWDVVLFIAPWYVCTLFAADRFQRNRCHESETQTFRCLQRIYRTLLNDCLSVLCSA